ncbi:MAG: MFS transporter [Spirulina sp. SIO3F2]|nr:MFS transporter [Spirulina sp. SIO3F2]
MITTERPPLTRPIVSPRPPSPQRQLPMILAAGSLTTMTGAVFSPVFPDVIAQLQLDSTSVLAGLLIGIHSLTIALFSPIFGFVADRTSPLKVLLPSIVIYSLAGITGAIIPGFWLLLFTRACLGAASGGIMAACLGWLGKNYEGAARARVIGYASGVLTISGIIYPLLGGWVGNWHWQYAFGLYALGFPLAVWVTQQYHRQRSVRRRQRRTQSMIQLGEVGTLLKNRAILSILGSLALAAIVMITVVIYGPLYLRDSYGVTTQLNGLILAARALGGAIGAAFIAKSLMRRIGHRWTAVLGFSIMMLMLISIPLLPQYQLILTAAIIFGGGFGLVMPTLYDRLASLTPEAMRSTVLAIGTGTSFLGQFIAPFLLGPIAQPDHLGQIFYGAAAIAFLAAMVSLRLRPIAS